MNIEENEGRIFLDDVIPDKSKRILTGDRPTGNMHIGHYFGSLLSRVDLQDKFDTYILIADVQALTDNFNNPAKVRKNVEEILLDQLSVGIDPNKVTFFVQSMIPEIPELTIYYSNLVTMARLERNPTIKTEIAAKKELFGEVNVLAWTTTPWGQDRNSSKGLWSKYSYRIFGLSNFSGG